MRFFVDAKLISGSNSTSAPLNITEQSAEPSAPISEDVYLDDGTNTASGNPGWRRYTGAAWEDVSAASGGAGGAPTGAEYVLLSANSTTTAERVLTAGAALAITDGGVSTGTVTVDVDVSKQSDIGTPDNADLLPIEDVTDGSIKKVAWSEVVSVASGAPVDVEYVVLTANSTTTAERVLTAGAGLVVTDGGVSTGTVTVGVDISPQVDIGTPASGDLLVVEDITDGSIKKVQWSETGGVGGGDSTTTDTYANIPAASNDGNLFFPSDGFQVERDTGAAWAAWGPLYPLTKPVDGDFSWVNQQSASVTTTKGGIYLKEAAGTSNYLRMRVKSIPSVPYVITAIMVAGELPDDSWSFGLCFRQSSDGKVVTEGIAYDTPILSSIIGQKWTNATTYVANYTTYNVNFGFDSAPIFLRIADDNTNRIFSFSKDGQNWYAFHTVGRTDHLTADQVGFFVRVDAQYPVGMLLLSWEES